MWQRRTRAHAHRTAGTDALLCDPEQDHGIGFPAQRPPFRTNVPNAEPVVRDWLLQPFPLSTVKKTVELCGWK